MKTCIVQGCEKEVEIREYCRTCYHRLRKFNKLPEGKVTPEKTIELPPILKKARPLAVRRKKAKNSIRLSYAYAARNYQLCYSLEQRVHWRGKMREWLEQAEKEGLTEADLCVTPEEERRLVGIVMEDGS